MHNLAIAVILVVALLLIWYAWDNCSLNQYLPQSWQKDCTPSGPLVPIPPQ